MNHHRRSISLVLAPLFLLLLLGAKGVPSTEEIRQLLAEKQYKRVLREVARAAALKGDDALGYDRGTLLLMRGEAQLGLRIEPGAAKSFREAAEAATNVEDRAAARAVGLLMSKSERLIYRPRTGDSSGREIDIATDRKGALAALWADELAVVEPQATAARKKKSIPDVLEAVTALEPIAALERAATGAQARTDELMSGFADQIETLLDEALIESDRQADEIEQRALGLIAVPQEVVAGAAAPSNIKVKKRGLARGDEGALREIMDRCREVVSRSGDVAIQLGVEPNRFRRATDHAIRLSAKAGAIARADYTGIQEQPNPGPKPARVESSGGVEVSP